jgi:hypothetical protein
MTPPTIAEKSIGCSCLICFLEAEL